MISIDLVGQLLPFFFFWRLQKSHLLTLSMGFVWWLCVGLGRGLKAVSASKRKGSECVGEKHWVVVWIDRFLKDSCKIADDIEYQ